MTHLMISPYSVPLHRRLSVAIVDDDEDDRHFIARAFQNISNQHRVLEFEDGEQLLTCLTMGECPTEEALHLGLILLDVNMHKMSGIEVLDAIKTNPALRHIPTVMLSTSTEGGLVHEAYRRGANGYLQKPHLMDDYHNLVVSVQTCFLDVPCLIPERVL